MSVSPVLRVILLHEIIYLLPMIIRNSTHFEISGSYIMLLGAYVLKYNYFEKIINLCSLFQHSIKPEMII